jgi:hypothetical protein
LIQARTTNIAHSSTSAMATIQELLAPQASCRNKETSLVTSPVINKKTTPVDALSDAQKDVRFARTRTGMLPTHVRVFAYTLHRSRKDALVVLTSPEECWMTVLASLRPRLRLRFAAQTRPPFGLAASGFLAPPWAQSCSAISLFTAHHPPFANDFAHKCAHQFSHYGWFCG